MLVSNLQQFLRLLAPPLKAAGINASAEKSVSGSLEAMAAALEPFRDLTTDRLTELLQVANHYRETGELPEWVVQGKAPKTATSRGRTTRAAKAPKITVDEAVTMLRGLQERSDRLEPAQIAEQVQSLSPLTVTELKSLQREFLGGVTPGAKADLLRAIQKQIEDFRESRVRVQGILAY